MELISEPGKQGVTDSSIELSSTGGPSVIRLDTHMAAKNLLNFGDIENEKGILDDSWKNDLVSEDSDESLMAIDN